MKNASVFAIIIIFFLFNSCSKRISCPGFDNPEFETWVPYKAGETFNFKNGARSAVLKIKTIFKTAPQKGPANGGFSGVVCRRSYILTGELTADGISEAYPVYISMEYRNLSTVDISGDFLVADLLDFDEVTESKGFVDNMLDNTKREYIGYFSVPESRAIAGRQFDKIQAMVLKSPSRKLDYVYIARGQGIVGFRIKGEGGDFVLQ